MFCDANVILRYILADHQDYFTQAVELIEENSVFIPFEVLAEVVYVLEKVYKLTRQQIIRPLLTMIEYPNISTTDSDVAKFGLELFETSKFDFVDCLLCAYNRVKNEEIATFDKQMIKYMKNLN